MLKAGSQFDGQKPSVIKSPANAQSFEIINTDNDLPLDECGEIGFENSSVTLAKRSIEKAFLIDEGEKSE